MPNWVSPTADIVTLVGFLLTLWVLIQTFLIKRSLVTRVRLPQIRQAQEKISNELGLRLLNWSNNKDDVLSTVNKLVGTLRAMDGRLNRKGHIILHSVLACIIVKDGLFRKRPMHELDRQHFRSLYDSHLQLVAFVKQLEKDNEWR